MNLEREMLDIVILAAGMGTRMKSALPKVLHPVAGRPMLLEVLATARALAAQRIVTVLGHGAEQVRALLGPGAETVLQEPQLGTGHAVAQAREALVGSGADIVLVLYGDTPLTRVVTLRDALAHHRAQGATLTLLSFLPDDPTGYGRVIRSAEGTVRAIVEHRDATQAQRAVRESNGGIMLFEGSWLWANLQKLKLTPRGEYYLTDLVALAVSQGQPVAARVVDEQDVMGVNDRAQLAEASRVLWQRRREHWLRAGVTMSDPATVWIEADVTLAPDTVLHPNVMLRGETVVGAGCEIGPFALLETAIVPPGTRVVPFSHLRAR